MTLNPRMYLWIERLKNAEQDEEVENGKWHKNKKIKQSLFSDNVLQAV